MDFALLDGRQLPASELRLELPNRGLMFGDGFFETLICQHGRVRFLPGHLGRMQRAAAALSLTLPDELATLEALTATLTNLVKANASDGNVRLRVQLWRAGGGLYGAETTAVHWLATAAPLVITDQPIRQAGFAGSIHTCFSPVSFCKGPYALHYVLAARERQARGLDELLLLDAQEHVAEAVSAAVFWIRAGELHTPALESGCVAGVRRAHLLAVAEAHGLKAHTGLLPATALLGAEAVFTANVSGIRAVEQIAGVSLESSRHPVLAALRRWEAEA